VKSSKNHTQANWLVLNHLKVVTTIPITNQ